MSIRTYKEHPNSLAKGMRTFSISKRTISALSSSIQSGWNLQCA